MNNKISIVNRNVFEYPRKEGRFRPSAAYPEYLFDEIVTCENSVYDMVREGFLFLGLDSENYGKKEWNPLKDYVTPGDTVLIKPNMVMHNNPNGEGIDCLVTNPSLVAAMIDYVLIALKGTGNIIVGDAPMQECLFQELVHEIGYDVLIDYYRNKNVSIQLLDFRNTKTKEKDGIHILQNENEMNDNGVVVNLGKESSFSDLSSERISRLRVTNYDPRILQEHHSKEKHEYMVSKSVLSADVIINMPKPKTHRKAGVTISLKNLVGINANKEYLPHHTIGSKEEGGDAYLHANDLLMKANIELDNRNMYMHDKKMEEAQNANALFQEFYSQGRKITGERYFEGSWYGNDTIWRTIVDLNTILYFADKNGTLTNTLQRKQFIVGDMIISGEKEGPVMPSPKQVGAIVMGDNPLLFDRTICSLMGFDYHKVPSLNWEKGIGAISVLDYEDEVIISNNQKWNKKKNNDIYQYANLGFVPTSGWEKVLADNSYRVFLIQCIRKSGGKCYIWGAGNKGIDCYSYIKEMDDNIEILAFIDRDETKRGKSVVNEVACLSPRETDKEILCIVAASNHYVEEIKQEATRLGYKNLLEWN